MAVTFRYRRDISSEWNDPKNNAVLKTGEPAIELDTGRMKVALGTSYGDNSLKKWSKTPYLGPLVNDSLSYNDNALRDILGIKGYNDALVNSILVKRETGLSWELIEDLLPDFTLAQATITTLGTVKSSAQDKINKIYVEPDGTMTINTIGIDKLVDVANFQIVFDGGHA